MTRELEARLKLTASDRTGKALASVSGKLDTVARKAAAVNRAQTMMGRASVAASRAMATEAAVLARVVAPAATLYAAQRSYRRFAETERALTRIGITADASAQQMDGANKALQTIAADVAMPIDEITGGLDGLVSAGKSLEDAMALLPAVARTAQASGAAVGDMAATAVSVGDSFRIMAGEMETAFDVMAAGGKAGKFELRDMAQYLPSLAPAFAAIGYEGVEGLTKAVAMLQVVRTQTGEAGEAATNMANVLQKMETEETAKKFADFGVDLRREMGKARREGRDLLETFLDLSDQALQGDLSKIPQLFTDAEFGKGMRALLSQRELLKQIRRDIEATAKGTVGRDLSRVVGDAEAGLQRLSNAFDKLANSSGRFLASFGVPEGLSATSEVLDDIAAKIESISSREGGLLTSVVKGGTEGNNLVDWLNQQLGGALNTIASERGRVGQSGDGSPGEFYPSGFKARVEEAKGSVADVLLGRLPTRMPRPAPERAGAAGRQGAYALPLPRPEADAPQPDISWEPTFALPRARGDGGAADVATGLPQAAVAAADSLAAVAESGRVVASMFGDTDSLRTLLAAPTAAAPPSPASDRPALQELDDEALARRLGKTGEPVRGAPTGATPQPAASGGPSLQELDDEALARRLGEPRPSTSGIGPTRGDATLGSTGSFRGSDELDAMADAAGRFVDSFDTAEVEAKLRALPAAMDPAAFSSAATAVVGAFRSALNAGLSQVEAEVRASASRMTQALSFTATPTISLRVNSPRQPAPVNADRGPSMSELGVP